MVYAQSFSITMCLCMLLCHDCRLPKPRIVNRSNTMDMPVRNNLSYITTLSPNSTTKTSGTAPPKAVSVDATIINQDKAHCDGPNYSCLGPQYETIDSRKESQSESQAHARLLSERYEYSEAHCVVATDDGTTEASAQYEVPSNLKQTECAENEDYSHLKH